MKLLTQLIKKLDRIIDLLSEEKAAREQKEAEAASRLRDEMLVEYAKKHNKRFAAPQVYTPAELAEKPIRNDSGEAIPYNLSDLDKAILRVWYEKTDNRDKEN